MLLVLLIAPLAAAALCCFASDKDGESSFKLGLVLAVAVAALGLPLVVGPPATEVSLPWFSLWGTAATVRFHLASDGLSAWLVQLATWLTPVAILASRRPLGPRIREFLIAAFLLEALMIGALLARDLALFVLCYEGTLVPVVIIIALFGGQERRSAALRFALYALACSCFLLVAIWWIAWRLGSTDLETVRAGLPALAAAGLMSPRHELLLFIAFTLAFAVKVPLVPLHGWQARAYAEAPTGGVVLMAGVMAKLGVYGFLRFVLPLFPGPCAEHAMVFIVLGLIGVVGGALIALAQDDVKRMLAFSSLSHLGLVLVGIFTFHPAALAGAPVQLVAHGLSIAALLLLVGCLEYRTSSRGLDDFGGLAASKPVFAVLFVVAALASAALPGTANFIGEFLILLGAWAGAPWWVAPLAGLTVILTAVYLLRLVQRWLYGPSHHSLDTIADLTPTEIAAVAPLLLALLAFGFRPQPILASCQEVMESLSRPARERAADLAAGRLVRVGPPVRRATAGPLVDPQSATESTKGTMDAETTPPAPATTPAAPQAPVPMPPTLDSGR